MKLGQILLFRKLIGRDQLREALRRQRATGRPVGEILLRMGVISRANIVEALLAQPKASVNAAALAKVSAEVVHAVPRPLAERHCCLGLVRSDGHLVLAMVDPLDQSVIAEVEAATQLCVLPVAASGGDLRDAIATKYTSSQACGAD